MAALRAVELRRLLVRRIGGEAVLPPPLTWRARSASTVAPEDGALAGRSAYEVLGVGETSPDAEIKASFHRLAKETHPDVAAAAGSQFLQILAAYEVPKYSNAFNCSRNTIANLRISNFSTKDYMP
jgi:DnaJ-domain-containing protein 1